MDGFIKKLVILSIVISLGTHSFGDTVLKREVIAKGKIKCSDGFILDILPSRNSSANILVRTRNVEYLFSANHGLLSVRKRDSGLYNAFLKDDQVVLAY